MKSQIVWVKGIVKNGVNRTTHKHPDRRSEIEKTVIQASEIIDIKTFLAQQQALSADQII